MFIARQGDVLIIKVSSKALAQSAKPIPRDRDRVILAYGEVTGHAHAILDRNVVLFDNGNGVRILSVDSEAALVHEEHATIKLPAGHYEIRQQREYHPEAIRNVAD